MGLSFCPACFRIANLHIASQLSIDVKGQMTFFTYQTCREERNKVMVKHVTLTSRLSYVPSFTLHEYSTPDENY
jgi:hypothetical protein